MNTQLRIFGLTRSFAFFLFTTVAASTTCFADFTGRYCELEGARTERGERVNGECYFYSDRYGDLEGARTESGESVSGECYRYSGRYAELEGARTENGDRVSGECYIY